MDAPEWNLIIMTETSPGINRTYPQLSAQISSYGRKNVELCVLGPKPYYFVSWRNGTSRFWGPNCMVPRVQQYITQGKIFTMSFGYGDSYAISFSLESKMSLNRLRNTVDLKGYYPKLQKLLDQNKLLSIVVSP
jgi:hypothetical protein